MPLPSGFEWIVILVIALLILGPGKLPDVAAAVGKSLREFRKASSDVQEAVKVDASPLPAGPAQPAPQVTPPQTQPTVQSSTEPAVAQPVAPIAPTAGTVSPVVTTEQPAPGADAAADGAPRADS